MPIDAYYNQKSYYGTQFFCVCIIAHKVDETMRYDATVISLEYYRYKSGIVILNDMNRGRTLDINTHNHIYVSRTI